LPVASFINVADQDPGSRIRRKKNYPRPGSLSRGSKWPRISDPDPQH